MGWVKLDDERAMNRKMRAAGFEARGLDEAAICLSAGDMTDGFVSECSVEMLAIGHGCRNWRKLVAKLVEVGRWEPADGGWMIHDYLKYNPSKADWEAEKATKRAAGRRGGQASAQARGQARASAPAQASASANGQAEAQAPAQANGQPEPEPEPDPLLNTPPPPLTLVRGDDSAAAFVEKVLDSVARRQMAGVTIQTSASGWLAKAKRSLREEWGAYIAEHAAEGVEALVDHIEPPKPEPKPDPNSPVTTADGATFLPGSGWVAPVHRPADCERCGNTGGLEGGAWCDCERGRSRKAKAEVFNAGRRPAPDPNCPAPPVGCGGSGVVRGFLPGEMPPCPKCVKVAGA